MSAAMLAYGRIDQVRTEISRQSKRLCFILDFFSQLREFEAQQKLIDRRQSLGLQGGDLGHHIGQ